MFSELCLEYILWFVLMCVSKYVLKHCFGNFIFSILLKKVHNRHIITIKFCNALLAVIIKSVPSSLRE